MDTADVIGRRAVAALIDISVMLCLGLGLALTMGVRTAADGTVSVSLEGAALAFYLGLVLLYFFVFEASSGQTVGKGLLRLRVVRLDGTPARPGAIATRTLLRLVDWLPLFNLVGLVCVLGTRRRQRIGDLLAKTVVVPQ